MGYAPLGYTSSLAQICIKKSAGGEVSVIPFQHRSRAPVNVTNSLNSMKLLD